MNNRKNDPYYINKIKEDLIFISRHMEQVSLEELSANEVLLDSMLFRMIQISENAKHISDPFRKEHPEIPWHALNGLRNRIVHDYGHVDLTIVYGTLSIDIPQLLTLINHL